MSETGVKIRDINPSPPVEKLFLFSWGSTFKHIRALIGFSLIPSALVSVGYYFQHSLGYFLPDNLPKEAITQGSFWLFIGIAEVLFAVAWFRFLLREERGVTRTSPHNLRKHHWSFFIHVLLFIAVGGSIAALGKLFVRDVFLSQYEALLPYTPVPAWIFICITSFLVFGWLMRFSYVLPAAAVGMPYSFATSWHDSRKQGLRLASVFVVLFIILFIIHSAALAGVVLLFLDLLSVGLDNSMKQFQNPFLIGWVLLIVGGISFLVFLAQAPIFALIAHSFRLNSGWSADEEAIASFD